MTAPGHTARPKENAMTDLTREQEFAAIVRALVPAVNENVEVIDQIADAVIEELRMARYAETVTPRSASAASAVAALRSLPTRSLDDDGDGYGGVQFISLEEAVAAVKEVQP